MTQRARHDDAGIRPNPLLGRSAGILLHPTSLPGPYGNGDIGPSARAFVDFLASARHRWWQMLPVGPTGGGFSPYSGVSAFAGNPILVSLDDLVDDGLLEKHELPAEDFPRDQVDYVRATKLRSEALARATSRLRDRRDLDQELDAFRERERAWLHDFALFMALRKRTEGRAWTSWDRPIARREPAALDEARRGLERDVSHFELEQFLFDRQWRALRAYASARGVGLIGDAPIFVSHDSADVWANQRYFRLDPNGEPTHVAGVPPDYFSETGQRWGNPLYRWKAMARDRYGWWVDRFASLVRRFDVVRLDHFIGFVRYWEIVATEPTAEKGRWMKGPGAALFDRAKAVLGELPLIAEDLGAVTPKVTALRERYSLPGMRILQFAFGADSQASNFLPHSYESQTVAYTGTHDNETIRGWFEDAGGGAHNPRSPSQAEAERAAAIRYLAGPTATRIEGEPHWELVRAVYASVAATAIIPLQDALGMGNEARMNVPGTPDGNWRWRLDTKMHPLGPELAERLRGLVETYGRAKGKA